jgi:hypothetical protein
MARGFTSFCRKAANQADNSISHATKSGFPKHPRPELVYPPTPGLLRGDSVVARPKPTRAKAFNKIL